MITVYDKIGSDYNRTRQADERILQEILILLKCPPSSIIADIGAGTGNYAVELARKDYFIHALEPSEKMLAYKRKHNNLHWFKGFAENIPFRSNYYDGAICIMSTHHFSSLELSLKEIYRILKNGGSLVIFTADLRMVNENCWIKEYFPEQYNLANKIHAECKHLIELAESIFSTKGFISPFPLPHNLSDEFLYSGWQYPEKF